MNTKELVMLGVVSMVFTMLGIAILAVMIMPIFVDETLNTVEREFENITVGCSGIQEPGTVEIDLNGIKTYCKLRRVLKDSNRLAYYR